MAFNAAMSARSGWAATTFSTGRYPANPVKRGESVDRREDILSGTGVDLQVKVKLVDRLDIRDFEEERPAVFQNVSRTHREAVVTGDPGMTRRPLG